MRHTDDTEQVAKRTDEILDEMYNVYKAGESLRPFAEKLARAEADLASALPDLDAAQHWQTRALRAEQEVERLRGQWPSKVVITAGKFLERIERLERAISIIHRDKRFCCGGSYVDIPTPKNEVRRIRWTHAAGCPLGEITREVEKR